MVDYNPLAILVTAICYLGEVTLPYRLTRQGVENTICHAFCAVVAWYLDLIASVNSCIYRLRGRLAYGICRFGIMLAPEGVPVRGGGDIR